MNAVPNAPSDPGSDPVGYAVSDAERWRRWRLVLGAAADGSDRDRSSAGDDRWSLAGDDARIDAALALLYDQPGVTPSGRPRPSSRSGGLGKSRPAVVRWLGDIRRYFPVSVVRVMQRDAVERLDLRQLLLEPEILADLEPDVHLVALLVELQRHLPDETRATARSVVARVLVEIERRLANNTRQAVRGALARSARTRRPRPGDIDWSHTIAVNLRHWIPEHRTVVPERLVGHGRRQRSLARDVVIAVDQSASMAESVAYASLFASVLARVPALRTTLIGFDTSVVDLTPFLEDPVDVLFGVQLGGGTDIAQALATCNTHVHRPRRTLVVLVSDLFEGGNGALMLRRAADLVGAGVHLLVLLALSDGGAPAYDHHHAQALRDLGATVMAATPDEFPGLLADALGALRD